MAAKRKTGGKKPSGGRAARKPSVTKGSARPTKAARVAKPATPRSAKPARSGSNLESLISALKLRTQTLSTAESCTGGLLSARICAFPGVSKIFMGAVVSYSNAAKENLLDVPETLNKSVGAVSTPVALSMARGARKRLASTWSVAITGIAGPDGGSETKPVGTVCFAVVGPGIEEAMTKHFKGSRTEVQSQSADCAAEFLLKQIKG